MPQPATKRRKLSHSDSEGSVADDPKLSPASEDGFDESDGSLRDGDAHDGTTATEEELGSEDEGADGSDTGSDDEDARSQEEDPKPVAKRQTNGMNGQRAEQRRRDKAQGDTYTGEIYKSNIFKLQVDELLDQVRLKYGKREAPLENALRTLKTIIERMPGREPLPVGLEPHLMMHIVNSDSWPRLQTQRGCLRNPTKWLSLSPILDHPKMPTISCRTLNLQTSMLLVAILLEPLPRPERRWPSISL